MKLVSADDLVIGCVMRWPTWLGSARRRLGQRPCHRSTHPRIATDTHEQGRGTVGSAAGVGCAAWHALRVDSTYAQQHVVVIQVPLAGSGTDATSLRALRTLCADVIPTTLSTVDGAHAYVAGDLAFSTDFNDRLRVSIIPVLIFVMGMASTVVRARNARGNASSPCPPSPD
jgi:hypothetical protein